MNNTFKILFGYIRSRLKIAALFLVFSGIFAVITILNNLPVTAVGYAFLLCAFFGFIAAVFDFISFNSKHAQLSAMLQNAADDIGELHNSKNIIEEDYRELIRFLNQENRRIKSENEKTVSDMTDYYTLWVHQIKTPISAMHLLLQAEKNTCNENIKLELFKIEQYSEMVLTYLKVNGTMSDLVLERQDLSKIVRQAVRKCSILFIYKKIKLNLSSFCLEVLTDEKWLAFVIEQLLTNALKYTETGSVSIYLNSESKLIIEDTGIGIAGEDIPRLFEKGYTGYNGRIYKKSTGVGLYLCKKIMTWLSHTIEIESEAGKGTRVILGFDQTEISAE